MNREDFPILNNNIIYFDNASTTLKPKCVIDAVNNYYGLFTANIGRGIYDNAILVNYLYYDTKKVIKDFINCNDSKEIVFTMNSTYALNLVVFGFMKYYLKKGDIVLISKTEHASNILPWFKLAEDIGIIIEYIPLNKDYSLNVNSILKNVNKKIKVISLAHVTNTIGDVRCITLIGKYCHDNNILFVVDASQSIASLKINFLKDNIDFLAFSSHKMFAPPGAGVLVGKYNLLVKMNPLVYGGGMNLDFKSNGEYLLKEYPKCLEAGTLPISSIIGLRESILYLNKIGLENIHNHEVKLKKYLVKKLQENTNIIMYNENTDKSILLFRVKNMTSEDVGRYLNTYNICVRVGSHCAKLLKEVIKEESTVRISLSFYNTLEEIDKLVLVLKNIK